MMILSKLVERYNSINESRARFIFCVKTLVLGILNDERDVIDYFHEKLVHLLINEDWGSFNGHTIYNVFPQVVFTFINEHCCRFYDKAPVIFPDPIVPEIFHHARKIRLAELMNEIENKRNELVRNDGENNEILIAFCEIELNALEKEYQAIYEEPIGASFFYKYATYNDIEFKYSVQFIEIRLNALYSKHKTTGKEKEKLLNTLRGKKLVNRILQVWIEDAIDEHTGELVSFEKHRELYRAGTFLNDEIIEDLVNHGTRNVFVEDKSRIRKLDTIFEKYTCGYSIHDIIHEILNSDDSSDRKSKVFYDVLLKVMELKDDEDFIVVIFSLLEIIREGNLQLTRDESLYELLLTAPGVTFITKYMLSNARIDMIANYVTEINRINNRLNFVFNTQFINELILYNIIKSGLNDEAIKFANNHKISQATYSDIILECAFFNKNRPTILLELSKII